MKLNALKLAISAAIVSAISMFLLVVVAIQLGRGVAIIRVLNPIFPGYNISWQGAGFGLVYGFVGCFVYTGALALIYNWTLGLKGIKIKAKAKPAKKKRK